MPLVGQGFLKLRRFWSGVQLCIARLPFIYPRHRSAVCERNESIKKLIDGFICCLKQCFNHLARILTLFIHLVFIALNGLSNVVSLSCLSHFLVAFDGLLRNFFELFEKCSTWVGKGQGFFRMEKTLLRSLHFCHKQRMFCPINRKKPFSQTLPKCFATCRSNSPVKISGRHRWSRVAAVGSHASRGSPISRCSAPHQD